VEALIAREALSEHDCRVIVKAVIEAFARVVYQLSVLVGVSPSLV